MIPDFKNKADLNSEVISGVTYRAVRDAFNRLGVNFHQDAFALLIWQKDIAAAHQEDTGYSFEANSTHIREWYDAMNNKAKWITDYPRTQTAIRSAQRRGANLVRALAREHFIEPYITLATQSREKRWQITDRGSTLRAQKLLKRMPRAKALGYLRRAIQAAETFNAEAGPNYYVVRLYLFGSILTTAPDVGDIDIIVMTAKRFESEEFGQWQEREIARMRHIRPSGLMSLIVSTEYEAISRVGKISPYISATNSGVLEPLQTKGEPYQVIYAFAPPNASNDDRAAYEKDIVDAASFLGRVSHSSD